jgi:carbamoyltransferase
VSVDAVDLIVESHLFGPNVDEFHRQVVSGFRRPYPVDKAVMISHHLAHAYGTYYASGFHDAAVLVVDGEGNSLGAIRGYRGEDSEHVRAAEQTYRAVHPRTTEKLSLYSVRGGRFEVVRKDFTAGSLGGAYMVATRSIFADRNEAGKTMGLAPFGRAGRFDRDFIRSRDGQIEHLYLGSVMDLDVPRPVSKWPEDSGEWSESHRFFADLAWKMQDDLERVLVDVARAAQRATGQRALCIAGGVGLNSVANKKILDQAGFEEVYIIPPAGDDGISLGCAFWGTYRGLPSAPSSAGSRRRLVRVSTGRAYSATEVERAARSDPRLRAEKLDEPTLLARTVGALSEGKIVGWFQGGSEVGPRALGHRSILADARHPDMKAILNRRVKFREAFRPFAPVVTLEAASRYFELDCASPYMLLIAPVKAEWRAKLPAITHVDGTARVQTVTDEENGRYYRLVLAFGERTGVPMLVNTSFNIKGEPIVETPTEAVECFLCNDMDLLVLEDWVIEKATLTDEQLLRQRPQANERVVLTTERRFQGEWEVSEARVAFRENREHYFVVTAVFAELLTRMDGRRTAAELAAELASEHRVTMAEAERLLVAALRDALSKNLLKLQA